MLSNVDSLGYYKIGNNIYTSKAIAYTKSLHTTEKLQYVYNDEIFKKYDWNRLSLRWRKYEEAG